MKIRKNLKRILTATAALLVCCIGGIWVYTSDYYRADETAQAAMMEHPLVNTIVYETGDGMTVFQPEQPRAGLIFYPGGKVEYTAYAPLLRMLAGEDILCVALEMPLNLAVLDVNAAAEVTQRFEEIDSWYIGGHSLGGSMAASHAAQNAGDYDGLILLASYSTADLKGTDLEVLSVYGTEDGVLNMEKYNEYHTNLPDHAREYVLTGGNHAQFGSYGVQEGDGAASITAEDQITLTAVEIVDFILK